MHVAPQEVALAFLRAIDAHDFAQLRQWMTDDHLFALNGTEFQGEEVLETLWDGWWRYVPDQRTAVEEIIPAGEDRVVLRTVLSGSKAIRKGKTIEGEWAFPAAVVARIRDDKVAVWREYYNPTPLNDLFKSDA